MKSFCVGQTQFSLQTTVPLWRFQGRPGGAHPSNAQPRFQNYEEIKLKWTTVGEFNSDDYYTYYCVQESLRRNVVAIIVNKRVQNSVLGCNLKNYRMISVCFQSKPFNMTVIQVFAPTSNAKEFEVEWFYADLQDLLELTCKKIYSFHYRGLQYKSRKSRNTWSNKQTWLWSTE